MFDGYTNNTQFKLMPIKCENSKGPFESFYYKHRVAVLGRTGPVNLPTPEVSDREESPRARGTCQVDASWQLHQ